MALCVFFWTVFWSSKVVKVMTPLSHHFQTAIHAWIVPSFIFGKDVCKCEHPPPKKKCHLWGIRSPQNASKTSKRPRVSPNPPSLGSVGYFRLHTILLVSWAPTWRAWKTVTCQKFSPSCKYNDITMSQNGVQSFFWARICDFETFRRIKSQYSTLMPSGFSICERLIQTCHLWDEGWNPNHIRQLLKVMVTPSNKTKSQLFTLQFSSNCKHNRCCIWPKNSSKMVQEYKFLDMEESKLTPSFQHSWV